MVRVIGMSLVLIGFAVSTGCANTQEVSTLRSQVASLEQRIQQLEQGGAWSGSGSVSVAPMESTSGTAAVSKVRSTKGGSRMTSPPSGKPSTVQVQEALQNAGFYAGPLDGKKGPVTREALKEFQRVHGLKADGVAGRKTWEKLGVYADLVQGNDASAPILK